MLSRAYSIGLVVVVSVILALALPGYGAAQEADTPLAGGAWALQFRISDNFTLSTFKGSVVSLKRHYSPNSALRAGLSLSTASEDNTTANASPDTVLTSTRDNSNFLGRLDLQYLYHPNPGSRVSLFLGTGPYVEYYRSTSTVENPVSRQEQVTRAWTIGFSGLLGVEWFPASKVGIHAEYGIAGSYRNLDMEETRSNSDFVNKNEGDRWALGGSSVLFGLSVYF